MKLLSAQQIRELDLATIKSEPVSSINLMERAAESCTKWILENTVDRAFFIICGTGNNGGDGLAIARQLCNAGKNCTVMVVGNIKNGTPDFRTNFERLKLASIQQIILSEGQPQLPAIEQETVLVDALIGSGLTGPAEGYKAQLIDQINSLANVKVSIDIPSGMAPDFSSEQGQSSITADYTLTFHLPKTSFLFAESGKKTGLVVMMDIGLSRSAHEKMHSDWELIDANMVNRMLKKRRTFDHKGANGSLAIIAGNEKMPGAAGLCALGALYSGVGLIHVFNQFDCDLPLEVIRHREEFRIEDYQCTSLAVGPGIGQSVTSKARLENQMAKTNLPTVYDADALNIIAAEGWLNRLKPNSVLTPHPKEFDRLFGPSNNDLERIKVLQKAASDTQCTILLKGAYSRIALPDGRLFFNGTGNPGMGKGGSGDVLTGLIGGLMAQGIIPEQACLSGVYLHGLAGDCLLKKVGFEGVIASKLAGEIPTAFRIVRSL